MALARYLSPVLVCGLLWAVPLRGQEPTGTISGVVTDVGLFLELLADAMEKPHA